MSDKNDIVELGKNTRFTSENQPDPKKLSKSAKKRWARKKLYDQIFKEFIKPLISKDGNEADTIEQGMQLIKNFIFGKDAALEDRIDKFILMINMLAVKEDLNIKHKISGNLSVSKALDDLVEQLEENPDLENIKQKFRDYE